MVDSIRIAKVSDAETMLSIYAPVVRESAISFELDLPKLDEFSQRIEDKGDQFPWLVYEIDDKIVGYAYAASHRSRAAYAWSVESSVYVASAHQRKGIARALYTSLFEILRLQGFYNVFAGITIPNDPSVKLHESFGFKLIGSYRSVGYKLGKWHDVSWWQLRLQENQESAPIPPLSFSEIEQIRRKFFKKKSSL